MTDTSTIDTSAAALRVRYGERYKWYVVATVMIGAIAAIMSSTIVNVAVPDLSRYFHLTQDQAHWVAAGFMGAMTLSMLPVPWLLDRYGYRRTYMAAIGLLMLGGIAGGLSPRYELVLAMRIAEGLAAGVLQPIPAIIVLYAFAPSQQGRAMGILGFGVVLAPAIGPSVGGILVEWFGWRSIFFVVVPFCAITLWLATRFLPTTAPGGKPIALNSTRFDTVGFALAAAATIVLLFGVGHLSQSGGWLGPAALALAAAIFAVFVRHQRAHPSPLLDLGLFRTRQFAMGCIVAFVYGMGLFGSTYLVPIFMQGPLAMPPSQAGAVLLPAGIALALTIPLAGRAADRYAPHTLVAIGLALLSASFLLMVTVGTTGALALLALWTVFGRIGLGLVLPSLGLGAVRGMDQSTLSQATSTINLARQLGGAVGVALVGVFLEWRLGHHGATLDGASGPGSQLGAFRETLALIAALMALAIVAALRMRPPARVLVKLQARANDE